MLSIHKISNPHGGGVSFVLESVTSECRVIGTSDQWATLCGPSLSLTWTVRMTLEAPGGCEDELRCEWGMRVDWEGLCT